MTRYRTPSGKEFTLGEGTVDEYADRLEVKLLALRNQERLGDMGQSKVFTEGLPALPDEEIQARDDSWDRYVRGIIVDVRSAVEIPLAAAR